MLERDSAPSWTGRSPVGELGLAPGGSLPNLWPLRTVASSMRPSFRENSNHTRAAKYKASAGVDHREHEPSRLFGTRYRIENDRPKRLIGSLADLKLYVNQNVFPQPETKLGLLFTDSLGAIQAEYFVELDREIQTLAHVICSAVMSLQAKKVYSIQFVECDPHNNPWVVRTTDRLIPQLNHREVKVDCHIVVSGRSVFVKKTGQVLEAR